MAGSHLKFAHSPAVRLGAKPSELCLDRQQRILAVNVAVPFAGHTREEIVGKTLEMLPPLRHVHVLLEAGFLFVSLPVAIGELWYSADCCSDGDGGSRLQLTLLECGSEAALVVSDFVQSIDPFSLQDEGGILLVDRAGFVIMVNAAFAAILGLRANDMLGRHVNEAYPGSTLSRLPKVMETGKAEVGEPHTLNGRQILASRWPLVKNGRVFGAYGKAQLREGLDAPRFGRTLAPVEGKAGRRSLAGHRPTALYNLDQVICQGETMNALKKRLAKVAERSSTVLLTGESGTGKELFAHAIHAASPRSSGPFVRVNCAAIPENLLEAELFGYVEGAFSGARRGGQVGKFEQAHGGTLFLDEISEMPLSMQAKLLRVLQEREVAPLGSQEIRFVDVRFVAATNCDPKGLVKDGKLRSDLYYRINVVNLRIPSLRERPEDVFALVRHFIDLFNGEFELNVQGLSSRAWSALKAYPFPGNVRELRSAIESAFNMVDGPFVRLYDLPEPMTEAESLENEAGCSPAVSSAAPELNGRSLQEVMESMERELISSTLEKVGGNKLLAANLLGISRPGLYKKLQKYNLY